MKHRFETGSKTKVHGVGQISISVSDVNRAVVFYRDVLDIPFLFQVPGTPAMAFFECDGTRLCLNQRDIPDHASGSSVIYFNVESVQEAAAELKSMSVTLESEPHIIDQTDNYTLWMGLFKDPDGNLIAVMTEERDLIG